MIRRRPAGRMVRTMGRTAVVAGTATAVGGRVARRQQAKAAAAQPAPAAAPVAAAPQPQAAPPPAELSMDEKVEELKSLAALNEQGILTDEEFAAQKAKILGS